MRLPMVDCRSLIEFCRAFEQHKNMMSANNNNQSRRKWNNNNSSNYNNSQGCCNSVNPLSHPFCDKSSFAALDILMLILVLGALGFLIIPYVNILYHEFLEILPLFIEVIQEIVVDAPIAYVIGVIAAVSGVIATVAAWEILEVKSRKCGKPKCKGLRKAVEFDIQLEPEECVRYMAIAENDVKPLELGQDHKELEAELKKMAPVNGRTVLIFRAPCGCPAGRLEVWGSKRVRRIKK